MNSERASTLLRSHIAERPPVVTTRGS